MEKSPQENKHKFQVSPPNEVACTNSPSNDLWHFVKCYQTDKFTQALVYRVFTVGRVCPIRYGITHITDLSCLNSNRQRSNWYIIAQGLKHAKTGIQHKSHWFSQSNRVWPKASCIPRTLARQSSPRAQRLSPRNQSRTSSKNKPFFWLSRVWVIHVY